MTSVRSSSPNCLTHRYSLREGASFAEQARSATLDLHADDGDTQRAQKASQLKWDRKKKRFIKSDPSGEGNEKVIRGESGALLPASFKSGRYATWKQQGKRTANDSPSISRGKSGLSSSKMLATAETILKDRRESLKVSCNTNEPYLTLSASRRMPDLAVGSKRTRCWVRLTCARQVLCCM